MMREYCADVQNRINYSETEELWLQTAQKDSEARRANESTSGGVLGQYVGARRLSATKPMSLFNSLRGERDGTHDQYHRFILSVLDALRGNRDCGSSLGRRLFIRTGLDPYVGPPALVYSSLGILVTLVLWVAFFRG